MESWTLAGPPESMMPRGLILAAWSQEASGETISQ